MSKNFDIVIPPSARVLLALPQPGEASSLSTELAAEGLSVELYPNAPDWGELEAYPCDVLLSDPELDARALLDAVQRLEQPPAVLLLATFGSIADAVEAMRAGADDYLSRPVSGAQIALALRRAAESRALRYENDRLRRDLGERFNLGRLLSRDEKMQELLRVVESIADTAVTVLLSGESGTGKTLLARTLHQLSDRREHPFVEVNCGALPPQLLESELFGHAKGAFTGAHRDKQGLFESADGGVLFLDEIASASLDLQVKLLRAIQDKSFERVGETQTRQVDVRVVAATNRDLELEVQAGRFREDLFWRLNVITLELPSLRERRGDIALLAETFLDRFVSEHDKPLDGIAPDALAALLAHDWPGNIRELENAIERAVLLAPGERLQTGDLPASLRGRVESSESAAPEAGPVLPLKKALEGPERRLIERALNLCDGHRQRAAALLGVNRTTLFNKMRKYDLLDR